MNERKSIIWELPIDKFRELVKKSNTIGEILKYFGLENRGGNSGTVKCRCRIEGVDFSHIPLGRNSNKGRKFNRSKRQLDQILVENSPCKGTRFKTQLFEEGILENKCSCCGNNGQWMGKKLVLQLDHVNGISDDHRIENLRILCPNCHSQTPTFAGKNIRKDKKKIKEKKCPNCNKNILESSKSCEKCYYENKKRKFEIDREKLKELIMQYSLTEIGKMFNVSDNAIRKRCLVLGIEIPKRLKKISSEK